MLASFYFKFGLYTWNCERGAELTTGGAVQFHNFVASDNWVSGISGKETFLDTFGIIDTQELVFSLEMHHLPMAVIHFDKFYLNLDY